jgi:hypothetical protein
MPGMSDVPPSYSPPPPPPPPSAPPPGQPGYGLPPGYQGPTAPDYPQPYQQQAYQQPPAYPGMSTGAGAAGIMSQFSGRAAWSIGIGLVTIIAPFVIHFVFYLLAIVGLIYGIQAIRRGLLIGGIVGIALNVIGGLLTIFILANS